MGTLLEMFRTCVSNVVKNRDEDTTENNVNTLLFCHMVDMLSPLIDLSSEDFVPRVKCLMVQNFILECVR